MENSKAYKYLIEQINAIGSNRLSGYYPRIMEEIYDWERDEVEDIIWQTFHHNKDVDLAIFLPKLKNYNGIKALKKTLLSCAVPSDSSVIISQVLYEYTEDENYLDIIKQNIDKDKDKISYVAILSYCKPCKKIYDFLIDIYINSTNSTIRSTSVTGILYNRGYIHNPCNIKEIFETVELEKKFDSNDMNERKEIIKKFDEGQL